MTQLEQDLINDEGLWLKIYKDTAGKNTIGVGRDLDDNPLSIEEAQYLRTNNNERLLRVANLSGVALIKAVTVDIKNYGITQNEAMYLLDNDIAKITTSIISHLGWFTQKPEDVKRVLVNMGFNMGVGTLLTFHNTLNFIKNDDYVSATNGMLDSAWAKEVGARATRLSNILKNVGKDVV